MVQRHTKQVRIIWTSCWPVAKAANYATHNKHKRHYAYNVTLWRAFAKPLLPWKSIKYYILPRACVCVRVRVRASACSWVYTCVCVGETAPACAFARVALLIQYATLFRHLSAASSAPPYFLTLSHKRHDFRQNVTEHKMCVFLFPTISFETFFIVRRIQRDVAIKMKKSSRKVLVILVGF